MCLLAQNIELNIPSNGGEKLSNYIMCGYVLSPHEHNEIGVSLLDLCLGRICIEKDHGSWDGGGPIWCIMLKKKCQMPP